MLSNKSYAGGVPLVVRLSERDILRTSDRPAPVVFILPRTTMLIAVLQDVLEFFSPYTAALNKFRTQVWFSSGGTPVSWMLPVGAVKDYLTELERWRSGSSSSTADRQHCHLASTNATHLGGTEQSSDTCVPPAALLSQPLELDFRIHQPSTQNLTERAVPLLVAFDGLGEFIRNEVRQLHKASYTAMYGTYKFYLNAPEAVLRSAVAMALYNPFSPPRARSFRVCQDSSVVLSSDQAGRRAQIAGRTGVTESEVAADSPGRGGATSMESSCPHSGRCEDGRHGVVGEPVSGAMNANSSGAVGGSSSGSSNVFATESNSSPYLLTEYQHLLKSVLHRRPVAYLVHLAFPYAHQHSLSNEPDLLRYTPHRVSAVAPTRCARMDPTQSVTSPKSAAAVTEGNTSTGDSHEDGFGSNTDSRLHRHATGNESWSAAAAAAQFSYPPQESREQSEVTLGVILWRLFRVPCLLWLARQQSTTGASIKESGDTVRAPPAASAPALSSASQSSISSVAPAAAGAGGGGDTAVANTHVDAAVPSRETVAAATAPSSPACAPPFARVCVHPSGSNAHTLSAYDTLMRSLAPFYRPGEGMSLSELCEPEALRTSTSTSTPRWATWECDRVREFVAAYEEVVGNSQVHRCGILFREGVYEDGYTNSTKGSVHHGNAKDTGGGKNGTSAVVVERESVTAVDAPVPYTRPEQPERAFVAENHAGRAECASVGQRIYFIVQGVQPSLYTPMTFLERHMTSSDRALYAVVQVA